MVRRLYGTVWYGIVRHPEGSHTELTITDVACAPSTFSPFFLPLPLSIVPPNTKLPKATINYVDDRLQPPIFDPRQHDGVVDGPAPGPLESERKPDDDPSVGDESGGDGEASMGAGDGREKSRPASDGGGNWRGSGEEGVSGRDGSSTGGGGGEGDAGVNEGGGGLVVDHAEQRVDVEVKIEETGAKEGPPAAGLEAQREQQQGQQPDQENQVEDQQQQGGEQGGHEGGQQGEQPGQAQEQERHEQQKQQQQEQQKQQQEQEKQEQEKQEQEQRQTREQQADMDNPQGGGDSPSEGDGGRAAYRDPADTVTVAYKAIPEDAGPIEKFLGTGGELPIVLLTCNRHALLRQTLEVCFCCWHQLTAPMVAAIFVVCSGEKISISLFLLNHLDSIMSPTNYNPNRFFCKAHTVCL